MLGVQVSLVITYMIFGAIIALIDISNKEIVLPRDLKSDGYNWFGSWTIFLLRSIVALPFWIFFTIICLVCKFIIWLFTVGGKGE